MPEKTNRGEGPTIRKSYGQGKFKSPSYIPTKQQLQEDIESLEGQLERAKRQLETLSKEDDEDQAQEKTAIESTRGSFYYASSSSSEAGPDDYPYPSASEPAEYEDNLDEDQLSDNLEEDNDESSEEEDNESSDEDEDDNESSEEDDNESSEEDDNDY